MTIPFPQIHWASLLPVILVASGGTFVLLWDAFFPRGERSFLVTVTLAVLASALGGTLTAGPGSQAASLGGMFLYDGFARFVFVLILASSFLSVLLSAAQRSLEEVPAGDYLGLILYATSGMMLMAATRSLLMVFVGLEIFSLSLYVLAGFLRGRAEGNEAALKYFLLGSFASGFLLYGMALIFGATGSVDLMEIAQRLTTHPASKSPAFLLGVGFVVVGLGFKVAAAPFYMWTPDVYEGAPTAVTAFMSVGPKVAAFAAFFRLLLALGPQAGGELDAILWVMAALTMTAGNVSALWQSNLKRMLAYSSIAHAGYLLVALAAVRGGSDLASGAFLFYMLVYAFMNMGAFCVVVTAGPRGEERTRVEDYAGMGYTRPALAAALALFMISLAGIPPTGGFVAKFYLFSAAVKAGFVWLSVIAVLNSVVSAYYYLRLVVLMYMREPGGEEAPPPLGPGWSYALAALVLTAAGILNFGLFPSSFLEAALRSTLLLN
ncbi:MAG: NADH-quinone oxidoreductase subunit N [Nitrospinota bacterium]